MRAAHSGVAYFRCTVPELQLEDSEAGDRSSLTCLHHLLVLQLMPLFAGGLGAALQASRSFCDRRVAELQGCPEGKRERKADGGALPLMTSSQKTVHCSSCHILVTEAVTKSRLGLRGGDMGAIS